MDISEADAGSDRDLVSDPDLLERAQPRAVSGLERGEPEGSCSTRRSSRMPGSSETRSRRESSETLGIMYAAVYTIPTRIFMWSVGLTYFTEAPTKKELVKKVADPSVHHRESLPEWCFSVSQFQLPGFVNQTVRTIAGANTFCAMLLIGCTLAEVPFKEVFTREVYYYTFIQAVPDPGHRPGGLPAVPDRLS